VCYRQWQDIARSPRSAEGLAPQIAPGTLSQTHPTNAHHRPPFQIDRLNSPWPPLSHGTPPKLTFKKGDLPGKAFGILTSRGECHGIFCLHFPYLLHCLGILLGRNLYSRCHRDASGLHSGRFFPCPGHLHQRYRHIHTVWDRSYRNTTQEEMLEHGGSQRHVGKIFFFLSD
jgi:hypothetical protein